MARKKHLWSSLSRQYRDRAAAIAQEYNLTRRQARERYNRGTYTPFARDRVPFKTAERFIPKPLTRGWTVPDPPGPLDGEQRRVYRRIMSWFPNDGYYLINGRRYYQTPPQAMYKKLREPSYHSSQGVIWHPANSLMVWAQVVNMSARERYEVLNMSREDFRSVASIQSQWNNFWYH